jgi:hypothetical protein
MTDSFYVGEFRWQGEPQNSPVEMWDGKRWILTEPQVPTDEELTWLWNHVATNRRQRMTWFEIDCLPETDYQQFARSVLRQWGRPATELEAQ